jgi:hypothetical protein
MIWWILFGLATTFGTLILAGAFKQKSDGRICGKKKLKADLQGLAIELLYQLYVPGKSTSDKIFFLKLRHQ